MRGLVANLDEHFAFQKLGMMEEKKPAYSDELLWVNHDSKNMKALPNRQKVFSHIQRHYRPWKRKTSTQELRNSKFLTNRVSHTISFNESERAGSC